MDFKTIKEKCESGDNLLMDTTGEVRLFIGFNRFGNLVTDQANGGGCIMWKEEEIKNWRIVSSLIEIGE